MTIAGHPSDDLKSKTWRSILIQAGIPREKQMKLKYVVVYEQTPNNFCAYAPDLPGCISTGKTWDEVREMMREAIGFHLEGMLESGESVPEPRMSIEEAKAYHNEPLSEARDKMTLAAYGDDAPSLSTTFSMVEVEVNLAPAARTS